MMLVRLTSLLLLTVLTVSAFASQEWPSTDIPRWIRNQSKADFLNEVRSSERSRERAFRGFMARAKNDSAASNRTFLFAAAIDLYNSLPTANFVSESIVEERKEAGLDLPPLKGYYWYYDIKGAGYSSENLNSRVSTGWDIPAAHGHLYEREYLRFYIVDRALFDPPKQSASVVPEQIDPWNPKYFRDLKRFMASMATAMAQGVSPDKAEEWTLAHCNDWGGCDGLAFETGNPQDTEHPATSSNAKNTSPLEDQTSQPQETMTEIEPEESGDDPSPVEDRFPVVGVIAGLVFLVGVFVLWRNRNKED